jgi:hypothetical protein
MTSTLPSGGRLQEWISLTLAGCLFASPWTLDYTFEPLAAWNAWASGVAIAAMAAAALTRFSEWEEWINLALGAWVLASPWVLDFNDIVTTLWAHVPVGLLVGLIAAWELWDVRALPRAPA